MFTAAMPLAAPSPAATAFQLGDVVFQGLDGRIAQTGVFVAGLTAETGGTVVGVAEGEGRGLVDRSGDSPGLGIDMLPCVDDPGHHAPFADVFHHSALPVRPVRNRCRTGHPLRAGRSILFRWSTHPIIWVKIPPFPMSPPHS